MSEQVADWVREIDETAQDVFDLATRKDAKRKAGSRRKAYEKGLREVRHVAGNDQAQELADWITDEMRSKERFPTARDVRQQGAAICRRNGHEVSSGSWLGA